MSYRMPDTAKSTWGILFILLIRFSSNIVSLKIFLPQRTQNNAKKQDDFYYLRFLRPWRLNVLNIFTVSKFNPCLQLANQT